ncbi:MAG: UDP-N-acetylmuramoyl-L-alanine--D-glutamate ligase [Candidatus Doudnabacteria bacterium]|nr:UDP-N-acetylmuramoyl-L-alanine--D-glutamate ligase [Candidatus Doudnabacteria bacterium]
MTIDALKDQKIIIAGLGVNNQHLAAYLKNQGIFFEVIENWTSLDELWDRLRGFDVIFRTPGLPYLSAPIQKATKAGVTVSSQTKLFFDLCPCPIIGVTGTKGKGTTSSLIYQILQRSRKMKVWLAGNIGQDPFEFIERIKPDHLVVLELSSFQLQDLHKSPHIAVVLNVGRDHIDETKTKIYAAHYSVSEYRDAKAQILIHQSAQDYAVLGEEVPQSYQTLGNAKKILAKTDSVNGFETQLLGRHNLANIAAAVEVARLLKIEDDVIKLGVKEFRGLPFRLQDLGIKKGIRVINDGFSTNPEATMAAIKSFTAPLIIIIGGSNKGFDFENLGALIKQSKNIKGAVVVGEETPKILKQLAGFKGKVKSGAQSMDKIVEQAFSLSKKGDTTVFSPGTASFDMFKNEKDRSEKFTKAVKKYAQKA